MKCPKCEEDMEYEEIKWPSGYYYCGKCDKEYPGERFACDSDGTIITDHEEKIY